MVVRYKVEPVDRETFAVVRISGAERQTVFMVTDEICALRVRDELCRADRRGFYEGLIAAKAA